MRVELLFALLFTLSAVEGLAQRAFAATNPPSRHSDSYANGEDADVVLAQPDLDSSGAGTGAGSVTLSTFPVALSSVVAAGIAFDADGALWLADVGNNRVLRFPAGTSDAVTTVLNATQADLVIGQADLSGTDPGTSDTALRRPTRVAFDAAGNLWVSDTGNHRVLRFEPPFANGASAAAALGQADLSSAVCGVTQTTLCSPGGVGFDAEGLWVADTDNNRVIHFPGAAPATGDPADIILGTTTWTSRSVHRPDGTCTDPTVCEPGENVLFYPMAVTVSDDGDLFVADHESSRVLRFSFPFSNGQGASLVLGSRDFVSGTASIGRHSLAEPTDLVFDGSGRLWTADFGNNRVLRYDPPFVNAMPAALVLGQTDFDSKVVGTAAGRLRGPAALAVSRLGDLWVADALNNRVVEYFATAFSTAAPASGDALRIRLGGNHDGAATFDCQIDLVTTFDGPDLQTATGIPPDTDTAFASLQNGTTYYLRCAYGGTTDWRVLGSLPTGTCNGPFAYDFSQVTLTARRTLIGASDVNELRGLVDQVRLDAGLTVYAWTEPALPARGTPVRAAHVQELRDALGEVYTACGQSTPSYSDETLVPGQTVIRTSQINEIREAARAVH